MVVFSSLWPLQQFYWCCWFLKHHSSGKHSRTNVRSSSRKTKGKPSYSYSKSCFHLNKHPSKSICISLRLFFSCEGILGTFEEAYVGKKPCNFSAKNYDRVLNANPFTHPSTKVNIHDYPWCWLLHINQSRFPLMQYFVWLDNALERHKEAGPWVQ